MVGSSKAQRHCRHSRRCLRIKLSCSRARMRVPESPLQRSPRGCHHIVSLQNNDAGRGCPASPDRDMYRHADCHDLMAVCGLTGPDSIPATRKSPINTDLSCWRVVGICLGNRCSILLCYGRNPTRQPSAIYRLYWRMARTFSPASLPRPFSPTSSIKTSMPTTSPPRLPDQIDRGACRAAGREQVVDDRTFCPSSIASLCISRLSVPYPDRR